MNHAPNTDAEAAASPVTRTDRELHAALDEVDRRSRQVIALRVELAELRDDLTRTHRNAEAALEDQARRHAEAIASLEAKAHRSRQRVVRELERTREWLAAAYATLDELDTAGQ